MTRLLRRLRYLLRRDRHERELDDELQFHLEMKRRELESRGLDSATAAAAARRAFGNLPLTRDDVRDVWIAPWLRSAAQDVRFAMRLLLKERGFTLAVVVVLGVGMALTGAMYTVVNAILFGSLPGDDGERIVSLGTRDAQGRAWRTRWRSGPTRSGYASRSARPPRRSSGRSVTEPRLRSGWACSPAWPAPAPSAAPWRRSSSEPSRSTRPRCWS